MAPRNDPVFGIAMRNFTKYPEMPSAAELIDYGARMEELGYESVWAWDHILLGVEPSFPIHEALTILTAIAARTSASVSDPTAASPRSTSDRTDLPGSSGGRTTSRRSPTSAKSTHPGPVRQRSW